MIRATRSMKARRSGGVCPSCRRTLVRGQSISLAAGRWGHSTCLAANLRTWRRAAQRIRDGTSRTDTAATNRP